MSMDALFSEFVERYQAGEAPDAAEYLDRAGRDADQLAQRISDFVEEHPIPALTPEGLSLSLIRPRMPAFDDYDFACLLTDIREERARTPASVARDLAKRLRLEEELDAVAGYYGDLECGLLPPDGLHRRVIDALAEALDEPAGELERARGAWRWRRVLGGPPPSPIAREDGADVEVGVGAQPSLDRHGEVPTLERLFEGTSAPWFRRALEEAAGSKEAGGSVRARARARLESFGASPGGDATVAGATSHRAIPGQREAVGGVRSRRLRCGSLASRVFRGGDRAGANQEGAAYPLIARRRLLSGLALLTALAAALLVTQMTWQGSEAEAVCTRDVAIPGAGAGRLQGRQIAVVAVWGNESKEEDNFKKVLRRFEQRTGAEVRFHSTGRDIADEIGDRIEGGCRPDVVILPQPGLLRDLVDRNLLQPVGRPTGRLVNEGYAPVWRRLGTVNGRLYGVWFKAANKSIVWYNADVFHRAGVDPPKSWDQMKRVAGALARAGIQPFSVAGADGWTLTDWFENVYLRTAGSSMYKRLGRHEIPWTHESVKRALTKLGEIFGQDEWLAGGTAGALETNFEESVRQVFSQRPRAAMVYEGDFVTSQITDKRLGRDPQFFKFPAIGRSRRDVVTGAAGATGGDVATLVRGSEAGNELMRFLATPQAAEPWARAGGFISPNRKLDLEVYPNRATRRLAQVLTRGRDLRFDLSDLQPGSFGSAQEGMWTILRDYLRRPSDVDSIARRLEAARVAVE